MELDRKSLGRLRRVSDPRLVWTSESGDFTPWLAENIDVLADALDMTLTVVGTEVPVGGFRLDIQAEDGDGRAVVIENQLERTDHGHLGQCVVYASGLEASTVVWVTTQFRDDFRRALDWLNERTDEGVQFFGVEVGLVQIGESGPVAPVFDVVSRPNDWQRAVKAASGTASTRVAPLNEARQELFGEVLEVVSADRPQIRVPSRGRDNWISFAHGPFGYWALSAASGGNLRVEAYLDCGDRARNKDLFDVFQTEEATWREATGLDLVFERLDERRAARIAAYHDGVDDETARPQVRQWAIRALGSMYDTLNTPLRRRASELRRASTESRSTVDVDIG